MRGMSSVVLDDWQERVLGCSGNLVLRSGRQVGKSTVVAFKAGRFASENRGVSVLVVAAVERQAQLLLEKILDWFLTFRKSLVCSGVDRPTKSRIRLRNGSVVRSLPTGLDGRGIRGYTIDLLIADEAAFIPEDVWTAVTPMLATTEGDMILLSTPHGREGYFYDCFSDPEFTSFHVSSEDCSRIPKSFLEQERKRMSKVQYAQEYLGEFVDELRRWFSQEWVDSVCVLEPEKAVPVTHNKYLGVDVARMGGDETVLSGVEILSDDVLSQFYLDLLTRVRINETVLKILSAERKYDFKKIYIDDGGLGVGVLDPLLDNSLTRRKVEAINNAKRSISKRDERRVKLLKEDLYTNLLRLGEQGKLKLFNTPEVRLSLKSIQYEYTEQKRLKIFGNYTHVVESLIRAAWCVHDKTLNLWIR